MSKPKVPKSAHLMEIARRKVKDVATELSNGAKTAIKGNAPKLASRMKPKSIAKAKKNPWVKCANCFYRVPIVCGDCMCAEAHVTEMHKTACCPGTCMKCGKCLNFCKGHDKNDGRDTDDQDSPETEADEKDEPEGEGEDE
jgi:hypothetical protein